MRYFMLGWVCVFSFLAGTSLRAAETVTVGGALVTIPDGWVRADADGRTVLAPRNLPQGVVCSLTLLGGEAFAGSVMDRLAADWKELASSGKMVWETVGAKVPSTVGPRAIPTRSSPITMGSPNFLPNSATMRDRISMVLIASSRVTRS